MKAKIQINQIEDITILGFGVQFFTKLLTPLPPTVEIIHN